MTKYREILRLQNLGINQTGIAGSCGCSRATVLIGSPIKGRVRSAVDS